jgi:hypothetical protein
MAKPNITRTYGPIHFEDLDPHRFEDLVRELIYDYKDWQSIEATGRSGSDEGFDVRAYEKISKYYSEPDEAEVDERSDSIHPMDGNLWMIQCKRENEIGPQKISDIITDCIKPEVPPYGYILVAPANFSKKSYDKFREELKKRGVMEFYLWGKAELEDLLHMPIYDRILFTFFGISLLTKKRSRSTEVRSFVATKNKLFRILGQENNSFQEILIRDINDTNYPFEDTYKDFVQKPRWKKYHFKCYHVFGIVFNIHEYYAYYDKQKNEWDYTSFVDLNKLYEEGETEEERIRKTNNYKITKDFCECLPKAKQSLLSIWGLVKFDDILVIDEKGDALNQLLHIYVDFKNTNGPFARISKIIVKGEHQTNVEKVGCKRINIFPEIFPEPKQGKIHKEQKIAIDKSTFTSLLRTDRDIKAIYDDDSKYDFLNQRDIIQVINDEKGNEELFIKITAKYKIKLKNYLEENNGSDYLNELIKNQIGKELNSEKFINVYEFVRTRNYISG